MPAIHFAVDNYCAFHLCSRYSSGAGFENFVGAIEQDSPRVQIGFRFVASHTKAKLLFEIPGGMM